MKQYMFKHQWFILNLVFLILLLTLVQNYNKLWNIIIIKVIAR